MGSWFRGRGIFVTRSRSRLLVCPRTAGPLSPSRHRRQHALALPSLATCDHLDAPISGPRPGRRQRAGLSGRTGPVSRTPDQPRLAEGSCPGTPARCRKDPCRAVSRSQSNNIRQQGCGSPALCCLRIGGWRHLSSVLCKQSTRDARRLRDGLVCPAVAKKFARSRAVESDDDPQRGGSSDTVLGPRSLVPPGCATKVILSKAALCRSALTGDEP